MRVIFSCIDESLQPPLSCSLCNLKRMWATCQKQVTKKPKSIKQLSKQSVYNSQVGQVCVSIVMQSNMAAVATWVFCQVNTGREVNAFQMFAEGYRGRHWMHSVINHAIVFFCHRRTYLSVPADWNHKAKRADKPQCSCQSECFDVTSKHRSYRQRCSSFASAACGGPSSCWVSSPQVGPGNTTENQNSSTPPVHVLVWFQASLSPPAGAAAAFPRCWSINRWCLSLRRKAATRGSSCRSWSTRRSLWWEPKVIPTQITGKYLFPTVTHHVIHICLQDTKNLRLISRMQASLVRFEYFEFFFFF